MNNIKQLSNLFDCSRTFECPSIAFCIINISGIHKNFLSSQNIRAIKCRLAWYNRPISMLMLQTLFGNIKTEVLLYLELYRALLSFWIWTKLRIRVIIMKNLKFRTMLIAGFTIHTSKMHFYKAHCTLDIYNYHYLSMQFSKSFHFLVMII